MEVRPGYKQTEAGIIPGDWEVKPLGGLFDFSGGFSASRDQLSETGHCYLHYGDIHGATNTCVDTYADFHYIPKLDIPLKKISPGSLLEDGDVVFVDASEDDEGTSRHIVVVNKGNLPFISGLHTIVAKSKTDELTHEYRRYCFQTVSIRRQFLFYAVGTKVSGISKTNIPKLLLPFPKPSEQRAIAAALGDVDALLAGLDRLITKKRDLKQAAMQQLLTGQTRLPGFSGEWEVKRLGDICRITTGRKDVNEGNPNGQYPFITCSRSHTFSDSYSFDTEAILIAGNGEVGNLHYFNGKFEAYQRTYVLYEFSVQVNYLWQQLIANLAESLGLGKIGSSIPYIKKANLTDFEFGSPKYRDEQCAIASVLSDMDAELGALEARRDKTRDLKQAMMQELLTGRTRLI